MIRIGEQTRIHPDPDPLIQIYRTDPEHCPRLMILVLHLCDTVVPSKHYRRYVVASHHQISISSRRSREQKGYNNNIRKQQGGEGVSR